MLKALIGYLEAQHPLGQVDDHPACYIPDVRRDGMAVHYLEENVNRARCMNACEPHAYRWMHGYCRLPSAPCSFLASLPTEQHTLYICTATLRNFTRTSFHACSTAVLQLRR